jgi:hypothetical protein
VRTTRRGDGPVTASPLRPHRPLRGHHRSLERHRAGDRARARQPQVPTSSASRSTTAATQARSPTGRQVDPLVGDTEAGGRPRARRRSSDRDVRATRRLGQQRGPAHGEALPRDHRGRTGATCSTSTSSATSGAAGSRRATWPRRSGRIVNVSSGRRLSAARGPVRVHHGQGRHRRPHADARRRARAARDHRQRPRARSDRHAAQRDVLHPEVRAAYEKRISLGYIADPRTSAMPPCSSPRMRRAT